MDNVSYDVFSTVFIGSEDEVRALDLYEFERAVSTDKARLAPNVKTVKILIRGTFEIHDNFSSNLHAAGEVP